MKKTALLTAIVAASALSSATAVAKDWSQPEIYGEVEVALQMFNHPVNSIFAGNKHATKIDDSVTVFNLRSNAAKLGVKGKGKLTDGIEGFYKLGYKHDAVKGGAVKADKTFLGLKGSFGAIQIGKFGTPMDDLSVGSFGKVGSNFSKNGHTANKITQYTTPDLGGIEVKLAAVPYEGTHTVKVDGKGSETYKTNDGNGISASAKFEQDGIMVGFAYDMNVHDKTTNPGKDVTGIRVVGEFDLDGIKLGAMYDMNSQKAKTKNAKATNLSSIVLSASMKMDALTPRASLAIGNVATEGSKAKTSMMSLVVGADYKFNDGAKSFANFGYRNYSIDTGVASAKPVDAAQIGLEVGLEYKF